jgi:hypothetical protein
MYALVILAGVWLVLPKPGTPSAACGGHESNDDDRRLRAVTIGQWLNATVAFLFSLSLLLES